MRQTITRDDITGAEISEPGEAVKVTFDGKSYTLDLGTASRDALADLFSGSGSGKLAALLAPADAPAARKSRSGSSGKPGKSGMDYAGARVWLRDTAAGKAALKAAGLSEVPVRGRLSPELMNAYASATGTAPATAAAPAAQEPAGSTASKAPASK